MKVRYFVSLVLVFCISSQILKAKTISAGMVSGRILDEETSIAVDFVNVTLFKQGSTKPYKVNVTNSNGEFAFTEVASGSYRLEAALLGYSPFQKDIELLAGSGQELGDILLKTNSKLLKTVEITGIRSNMKMDIDKKTYSIDQSIAAAGASASDILKDIPSVEVDAEGSISLRSSQSVTIWINGKPSGLTAENRGQVLEQMPAENIDRIEVVTNPSAKYSPEGSAGIINILLKKNRKAGYYGSLNAGINQPWGKNFGANLNYSSSKLDAFANLGFREDEHSGSGKSSRQTYGLDKNPMDTTYLNSSTKMTHGGHGLFMRAGLDYHLNDKHTLSLSGFAMDGGRSNLSDITNNYLDTWQNPTKKQLRNTTGENSHKNMELSFDYLWEIAAEHSLQANLSRGQRRFDNDNTYKQTVQDLLNNNSYNSYQIQKGPATSNDWELKIDYSKKFSENWKLEAGLNSEWESRYSENGIFNGLSSGTGWIFPASPNSKSGFDYDEQIHALYATLTGKVSPKFGYQLGLRAENSIVSFSSSDIHGSGSPIEKNRLDLFPTLFLNYNLATGSDVQLNYSRRINRPRGRSLNPYVDISDTTLIRTGNPDLNPEYSNAFELNFMKTWKNHTLSSSLYHRTTAQVIQDIKYIDNSIMYQKPYNVTNTTASGLELVAKNKLSRILETTSTINLYESTMEAFRYRNYAYPESKGFSWNARLNGTLLLPKNLTAQISGFYTAPKIEAQGESRDLYSMDLGLRKSFMDSKLQLAFNARNILNTFKFENKSWGPGFYEETSNKYFGRDFRLNLTWNFGNLKPKPKAQRGNGRESENAIEGDSGF